MTSSTLNEFIQVIASILFVIEFILGAYVLVLNFWHIANRHVAAFLLTSAVTTIAMGILASALDLQQATIASVLLAITIPMEEPLIFLAAVVLLRPHWMAGRLRHIWWVIYGALLLPFIFTILDLTLNTQIWYTGLDAATYQGGFAELAIYAGGALASQIRLVTMVLASLLPFIPAAFVLLDKKAPSVQRRLALLLSGVQLIVILMNFGLRSMIGSGLLTLATAALFSIALGFVAFTQMISERKAQRGSLQVRLALTVLVITVPIVLAAIIFLTNIAGEALVTSAEHQLGVVNRSLGNSITLWTEQNSKALAQLAVHPDIVSMEADRQKPLLESMQATYSYMYLISTTDLAGINVARSDMEAPKDYSDRIWFQQGRQGIPLTIQILLGRTNSRPAMVMSIPIKNAQGEIVGVSMFASELDILNEQIAVARVGEGSVAYVIDEKNTLIAHTDQKYLLETEKDFSEDPAVKKLNEGVTGLSIFQDNEGVRWHSYVDRLENGWGVVVQRTEADLFAPIRSFQVLAWVILTIGASGLTVLAWLAIRQALLPIGNLTEVVTAITAGNRNLQAEVDSGDEIGILARSFNSMTQQVRELVTELENRVTERTQTLEKRAVQLRTAAQVGREAAAIRDVHQLLEETTHLISERFGYYHVGIFLIDEAREYAILQASNSEGGQRMLARGHKLGVGQVGIVGYVAERGEARIALDVGADAVFFNNPDLPDTRSEMALALKAHDRIIGILDVQSTEASAFSLEDIEILQVMADQIALAIENARLIEASQQAYQELETTYGQQLRHAWAHQLGHKPRGFSYTPLGVKQLDLGEMSPLEPYSAERAEIQTEEGAHKLVVPILLRGQVCGSIAFKRDSSLSPWSSEDLALAQEAMGQIAQALENARLVQETERRAERERVLSEVANQVRTYAEVETVLQTAIREVSQVMRATSGLIVLHSPDEESTDSGAIGTGSNGSENNGAKNL